MSKYGLLNIKYSIIYMKDINYFLLYVFFIFLGVLLIDNNKLRKYKDKKRYLIRFGIFIILLLPISLLILISRYTEKGFTLYKLFNYYDMKYGDRLNFIYHIKTRHVNDKNTKTPKCKIEGEIINNNLKITKMEDCDEEKKDIYKELITNTQNFDNGEIGVGSEIKDFTF